jgi:hypothetical protein
VGCNTGKKEDWQKLSKEAYGFVKQEQ